jgi:hypothetical protein
MENLTSNFSLIAGILSIAMIIAFFIMASRLGNILKILEFFRDIELKKPEHWFTFQCENCKKDIKTNTFNKGGTINCPECKRITRVP